MKKLFTLFLVLMLSLTAVAQQPKKAVSTAAAEARFEKLVDQFYDFWFKWHPSQATAAGFHQHDTKLEDKSAKAVKAQIAELKQWEKRLASYDSTKLSESSAADREILLGQVRSELLDLETFRKWETSPDQYSSGLTYGIYLIMSRDYASQDERLKSVIARQRHAPARLAAARVNLKNPPEIYTRIALMQLPGTIGFFQNDVPKAFDKVQDQKLLAEFKTVNAKTIEELKAYEKFLKDDLLPLSKGDFRIGAENYRKKLFHDEMVDTPLDRLLEVGWANLRENQRQFKEVSALIDPNKTAADILKELEKDHPAPENLIKETRDLLQGMRDFLREKKICTVPSDVLPIVQETPPFARATSFASMDTPGAYEKVAKEAYFSVTLPEPTWTPEQIEEHMAAFNRGTVVSTAIHEAFPGHYTQFLWVQQAPSKVRKLSGAGSNSEGYAHYTEQMMMEEGYGRDPKIADAKQDKKWLMLRLGQLQDALLRNARYIVGIEMHTGKMTYDQGVEFFVKEGYQTRTNAERETRRGTADPTYLIYTLGKLQILKLREDYKAKMGDKFSLQEFHDGILKQGYPPIKVVRKAMMGDDSPVL